MRNIKIILVEDQAEVLSRFSAMLTLPGYSIFQATTKRECINFITKERPGLILLSDELPDGNGLEFCQQLKADPSTSAIAVILCSSSAQRAADLFSALGNVADGFLTKDAHPWQVLPLIHSLVQLQQVQVSVLGQQHFYSSIFEYHPDAVYSFDLQGNFTSVNQAGTRLTGYSKEELLSMSFVPLIAADQLSKCLQFFEKVLKGETHYYNAAIIDKHGHRIEVNITGIPIVIDEKVVGIYGISKDITRAVRLEKITLAENQVLALALSGSSLQDTLTYLLTSIEQISEGMLTSIMLLEDDGKTIKTQTAPSLPKTYTDAIDGAQIGPKAGSCGTAIFFKEKVFVSDISLDERWESYRNIALQHGLSACFSFPIVSSTHQVLGAFACYYTHPQLPDEKDSELMERAVNLAGLLIGKDKAKKQVQKSEQQLEEISNFLPGALYQFQLRPDGSFCFPYFSPNLMNLYGITPEQVYADPQLILQDIYPQDVEAFFASVQHSAQTLQPWILDYRVRRSTHSEGEVMWVRGSSIPRKEKDGSILWNGLVTDITDIKKQEETLRMLSRAVESAAEGIVVTDASMEDDPIVFVNEKFLQMIDYSREEVLGRNCRFLQGKDTDKGTINEIRQAIQEQKPFKGEIVNYRKEGTPFWNLLVIAPVVDQQGKVTQFVGLINDITERKKAEQQLILQNEQLKKINQELDQFVYSVSHNLRAPLTSILGLIGISRLTDQVEQRDQYLNMMEKSVEKLDFTIRQINDYAKNERIEVQIEKVNFHRLLGEVIEELSYLQETKGIAITVEIDPVEEFYSDESRLRVVLLNLLSNGIKYHDPTKEKPFIHITIYLLSGYAHLSVKDNGIGIGEEYQEKVFSMFYRANESKSGSGLGLYIVKESVTKMKGTIRLESRLYEGSEFIIRLPNLKRSIG
jgi:PAS domain S-box-containing protein